MSQSSKAPSTAYTYGFIITLCCVCALTLSVLASVLRAPQALAQELDRSKQMLLSAKIMDPDGYFLVKGSDGQRTRAVHIGSGKLQADENAESAGSDDVLTVFKRRINSFLVDGSGKIVSFDEASVNEEEYVASHAKDGYARLPHKLIYEIRPNPTNGENGNAEGFIVPVNGMGLWDRIYGYIAIEPDANSVIGIAWYKHAETPGLGANISTTKWQMHFPGKRIFQQDASGSTNFTAAPLGIEVRRGKVVDELGDSPKALSAVDGMAGATLTGVGVTKAYKDSLGPYRSFLINKHKKWTSETQR